MMRRFSVFLAVLLGSPSLVFAVLAPTPLHVVRAVLALLVVAAVVYAEKPTWYGTAAVLCLLGIWQLDAMMYLPENTGYAPIFLLAPWVLYRSARNLQIATRITVILSVITAFGSFVSPLMWRITEYPFGFGLTRRTGFDGFFMMITHWSIIISVVLWGLYQKTREEAALREKQQIRDEERALISVEIHDILAHSLTLIRMQASAGLYDPSHAHNALTTIQEVAGNGIDEVRTLISTLRGEPLSYTGDINDVVAQFRAGGMSITADIDDLSAAKPTTIMAVRRILSETLTNAAKHQTNPEVAITITTDSSVEVTITSVGQPRVGTTGNKVGIESLGERCHALGGEFDFTLHHHTATTHASLPLA